ncbi:MAG: hypothetical protein GWN99_07775 [Gemmatimonadetes bacterium]|uniref:Uncharacterized protein n=1 Tax=Candidatus Kutchimonas denitrificans TaxID=3056748 RepID=A0AAE4Z9R1_9BACT|nr:hypothetical protein [Gemmatimonadota bacterium]NIR75127.1 hypothetical protein [Candidatus Kutchimonas denitrificans]NIS00959.1 hypothetical protein [Gemmatimonadota bacterium]NIT66576.1 hypothetical protein [Gemmatimonadota bacterium]NIU52922.1 hypothetical protein [Gemmatimonadota bacterium]
MPRKVRPAKREFEVNGRKWLAEFTMHAGTDRQAPNLMVIFRDPVRAVPDRYNTLPAGKPKMPKEAAKQVTDDELRALLQRSVAMKRLT